MWVLGHMHGKQTLGLTELSDSAISYGLFIFLKISLLFPLMAPLFLFDILKCGISHNSSLHVPSSFLYIFFLFWFIFHSVPSITCICLTSESIALHFRAFFFMFEPSPKAQWFRNHTIFLFTEGEKSKIKNHSLSPFLNSTSTFPLKL